MIYDNLTKKHSYTVKDKIDISFIDGAKVAITSPSKTNYTVKFFNHKNNDLVWVDTITDGMWTKPSMIYFVKWRVEVWKDDIKVKEHIFNCKNKRIYIHLDSKSLGDTIAWFPYVEEFRKKHKCEVICSTFHNDWFYKQYPEINFTDPGSVVHDIYALYRIGWYYNKDNTPKLSSNPTDFRKYPLQKTASDILGLQYKEIKPKIYVKNPNNNIKEKYVVIAPHGSKHSSYWHYEQGWQYIINWLNKAGYKVVLLCQEPLGDAWHDSKLGGTLQNVINKTGDIPLQERFTDILNAEAFIGIGSGLSWISWALGTPTVLISGFSEEYTEFQDCERISASPNVCSGCFNTHRLDPGDWKWCPHHKDTNRHFECSKSITPDLVADALVRILG